MKYRALTASGDYQYGQNLEGFLEGADAVAQAIKTTLQLWLGEWWEDTSQGVPYLQHILGVSGTPHSVHGAEMLIQDAILNVPGVQQITYFTLKTSPGRKYSFSADVQTQYGTFGLKEVPIG